MEICKQRDPDPDPYSFILYTFAVYEYPPFLSDNKHLAKCEKDFIESKERSGPTAIASIFIYGFAFRISISM